MSSDKDSTSLKNRDIILCATDVAASCKLIEETIQRLGLQQPSKSALRKATAQCNTRYKRIVKDQYKKGHEDDLEQFLEEEFRLPRRSTDISDAIQNAKASGSSTSGDHVLVGAYGEALQSLGQELTATKSQLNDSLTENREIEEDNRKLQRELVTTAAGNANLKRKIEAFSKDKKEAASAVKKIKTEEHRQLIDSQKQLKLVRRRLEHFSTKQKEHRMEIRRLQVKVKYYTDKAQKQKSQNEQARVHSNKEKQDLEEEVARLQKQKNELTAENKDLHAENLWLRALVEDNKDGVVTFYDGRYTSEMQQCVYSLLSSHVACSQVGDVINAVLKLVGKTASHTPCKSTVINMNTQRLILAQKQLGEQLPGKGPTCLLSDETTKFDQRFEGMHVSDQDGRVWVLGLRELQTKAASDVHNTFQEILADIDERSHSTNSETSNVILTNIVARMSDRAATEMKLGQLIEETRLQVLPLVQEGYKDMSDADIASAGKLLVFACGLHGLVHMAETIGKSLIEAEKGLFDGSVPTAVPHMTKASESGTV